MTLKKGKLYALPAGQGDCLIFQFQNENGVYKHILVDGGNKSKFEFKKLKKTILKILKEGNNGDLDLVIVTHSDDDHISGILRILGDTELNPKVKDIWFNAEKTISNFFETEYCESQKYQIIEDISGVSKSSRQQDNDLYDLLESDTRWKKELIYSGKEYFLDNLKIKIISPSINKLKKLNEYWPKQKLKPKINIYKSSSKNKFDYDITYEDFLKNTPKFKEDESPVNGGSIALILEWGNSKFLLLSDAHPSVIVENLKLINNEDKLKIDVTKISHHGSEKNTNDELINILDCENFIVSANANRSHFHPDKAALCRILKNNGLEKTKFYFTHDNEDLRKIFILEKEVNAIFPKDKDMGVCLAYEY